ncbi:glycerophosphoryl diester phosphodiesterase (predicted) [Sugiyamaella lignohabitans]|uniref:Glycerophosphoryl diester phosphodiesterase (Predicted) n=1 Tax=Sugiyamaella lignohabitans TaxID=796027 RepID=A0A161HHU9_9ASCO|nr:glycerophosphoryl diester phosphodiesterase (predicted) [Sugiyamaella lignohabitans]ANB11847.1 glycerophosphoryl diester phosphodiesterase (predicted) [Sugiyamaella lignohabitans]
MLDIKRTNEPWVIPKIVEDLKKVNSDLDFWGRRMVLGIWRWDVLESANSSCPTLPVLHIGFSRSLARKFLAQSQVVGISLNVVSLNVPGGSSLIHEAKQLGKLTYAWTVNQKPAMKWAASMDLDGIITDHPDVYAKFIGDVTEKEIETIYAVKEPSAFYTFSEKMSYRLKFAVMWMWVFYLQVSDFFFPSAKGPF